MRQQTTTTTLVTYSILLFAGAVPLAMPRELMPASASGANPDTNLSAAPAPIKSASEVASSAPSTAVNTCECPAGLRPIGSVSPD